MENGLTGEPVNTKSLLAFLFKQMNRLNAGEIDVKEAVAQAKLAKQANNILDYELKRTDTLMRLKQSGDYKGTPCLRDVESKGF
jgi:hypothetical protein